MENAARRQMLSEPQIVQREAQPYVGIRTQVPVSEMPVVIPKLHGEVYVWLRAHGISPSGAPFIRYHVINMPGIMDIEMGVPIAADLPAAAFQNSAAVQPGSLPAGRYAVLTYIGIANGMTANAALLDWGAKQGLVWDQWAAPTGDGFGSRYESFITDPKDEPDMANWETEVAIRLLDRPNG